VKQIKILLSSVLTLLLITGNNVSYASPHIRDFGPSKFKANKPNINTFKGQVRKGNIFKGNVFKPRKAGFIDENGYTENKNSNKLNDIQPRKNINIKHPARRAGQDNGFRRIQERGDKDKPSFSSAPAICECDIILENGNFFIEIFWCDEKTPKNCLKGTKRERD